MANLIQIYVSTVSRCGMGYRIISGGAKLGKSVLLGLDGDFLCAHLWLKVVGCDLGRGDQIAIFILGLPLHSAVEEEGDVSILSVFVMLACLTPLLEIHSTRTSVMRRGGQATVKGNSALYLDILVTCCKKIVSQGPALGQKAYKIFRDFGIHHIIEFSDGGKFSHPVRTVVEEEMDVTL